MFSLAQGSTRYNLSKTKLITKELLVPVKPEQCAIARVLSDMDSEIEALVARREKTALIKQGMMQELLTGRTRLA
jgi:type I restriction enzyme S subunit